MKKRISPTVELGPKSIEVVAAVLVRSEKILIAQRADGDAGGGLWEFPGGKRELGESREQALKREIQEELSMQIDVGLCFGERAFTHGEKTFNLILFLCSVIENSEPVLHEHQDVRWVLPDELEPQGFSMPDIPFLQIVKDYFLTNLVK